MAEQIDATPQRGSSQNSSSRRNEKLPRVHSTCPHDCPSTCALEVEIKDAATIGRVYGAKDNSYTEGVICAKVARYAERVHHPERLTRPLRRKAGYPKALSASASYADVLGDRSGFEEISWQEALDTVASRFQHVIDNDGAEALWPYHLSLIHI